MSLHDVKRKMKILALVGQLGNGHEANLWHVEDEPSPTELARRMENIRQELLCDVIGDFVPPQGRDDPFVVNPDGYVICMACKGNAWKSFETIVDQPGIYSRRGIQGAMKVHCENCKRSFVITFKYDDDWAPGHNISMGLHPLN